MYTNIHRKFFFVLLLWFYLYFIMILMVMMMIKECLFIYLSVIIPKIKLGLIVDKSEEKRLGKLSLIIKKIGYFSNVRIHNSMKC
jgi:hypothetical protein